MMLAGSTHRTQALGDRALPDWTSVFHCAARGLATASDEQHEVPATRAAAYGVLADAQSATKARIMSISGRGLEPQQQEQSGSARSPSA